MITNTLPPNYKIWLFIGIFVHTPLPPCIVGVEMAGCPPAKVPSKAVQNSRQTNFSHETHGNNRTISPIRALGRVHSSGSECDSGAVPLEGPRYIEQCLETVAECTSRGRITHDLNAVLPANRPARRPTQPPGSTACLGPACPAMLGPAQPWAGPAQLGHAEPGYWGQPHHDISWGQSCTKLFHF